MKKINKLIINGFNQDRYNFYIKDTIVKYMLFSDKLYYERFINDKFFGFVLKIIKNKK